ncbi:hypothetical protein TNCV_3893791 [Trichonephila clavipes]|nr:hypothetical protein TNCV_3893791 [Trichonephila clavipes]
MLSKKSETTLVHYVLTTHLPNKLWKPTLVSRAAKKMVELVQSSFPILQFFWGTPRYIGCSQWVGCPAEGTDITHVQVLPQTSQMKYMATVCLFWPVHRAQTDGAHVGHLKHGIGPFLCITSIQHRLSQ